MKSLELLLDKLISTITKYPKQPFGDERHLVNEEVERLKNKILWMYEQPFDKVTKRKSK